MDDFGKFYNRALRFLSFRPRSEKEISDYLKKKSCKAGSKKSSEEINRSVIEKIIQKLKEQRFLNDEEFARWWIEQRTEFKPRSLRLIKIELKQKGINNEIIESQIVDSKLQVPNDLQSARKLVEKQMRKYRNLPKEKVYQKLFRFLASKGFDYETIKEAIKNEIN
ncbi:MAG: RecX family transcriptional regulator [Patescibacteria group bacterium]|nr:RecX family transcriptional regulator [Patescibacteria group bacterium]